MTDIIVKVRNKVARLDNPLTRIVADNTDYTIVFDLDDEWGAYDTKTARFDYQGGTYSDVVFDGTRVAMPATSASDWVKVGLYAGELHTSTPATIGVRKSILSDSGMPADPPDDVYNQLMARLNELEAPDAVLYKTEQNLSNGEALQARRNIGIKWKILYSPTDSELARAISELESCNALYVSYHDFTNQALQIFPHHTFVPTGGGVQHYGFAIGYLKDSTAPGVYEYFAESKFGSYFMHDYTPVFSPLVVTFTDFREDEYGNRICTADKTYEEITAALEQGTAVIGRDEDDSCLFYTSPMPPRDYDDVVFRPDAMEYALWDWWAPMIYLAHENICYVMEIQIPSFEGAGADRDGYTGLVPAPTKDDFGKFLSADGTWKEPTIAATGDLTDLTTTDKTDLVSAINEVNGKTEGEWIKLTEVTTEEEVQTMSLLWKGTPCKKVLVRVITGAADQAAGYMPTNVATTYSALANPNPWILGVGRFYPAPLPQTSHRNITYVIEMVDMPDDVTYMHFTESYDNAANPTTILPLRAVQDAWTRGNYYGSDTAKVYFTKSDGIEGVQFQSYSYFPVGSVFEVWGIKRENL